MKRYSGMNLEHFNDDPEQEQRHQQNRQGEHDAVSRRGSRDNQQRNASAAPRYPAERDAEQRQFCAACQGIQHVGSQGAQHQSVDAVGDLLLGLDAQATQRFPNLELWQPPDDAVYFDAVHDADGGRWASPVQTYLEMATGDAQTQAAAVALRASILGQLESGQATGEPS